MKRLLPLLLCTLAALSARATVQGTDFEKKIAFTPSSTALAKIGATGWTDFPVLVRLPATVSSQLQSADGTDLYVEDENETPLAFEVESFDPAGTTLVWVKVPSLSSATELTVFFGGSANTENDPTAVWTDYAGVWHMSEASGAVADATGNNLAASPANSTAVSVAHADGKIGTGRQTATSSTKDYLTIPNYNSLSVGNTFTFSCWYDATDRKGYDRLVSRKRSHTDANGWEVEVNNSNTKLSARGASSTSISATIPDLVSSGWQLFTFVYSGSSLTAYCNGAQVGSGSIATATDNGYPLSIGCDSDGSEAYFVGYVDEARLRKGALTAAGVALEYATMADAAFFDAGAIQTVDATAQIFETPTAAHNVDGTTTVTVILTANHGNVGVIYEGGLAPVTNIVATAAAPGTFTDTPTNLSENTTYAFSAYGKNANGTEVVKAGGVFYNGDLSVATVTNANEKGLVPGVFRISRADTAHDISVSYTVGGTAVADQSYVALPGTATIPAGATYVDVTVTPLNAPTVTEDVTVSLSLDAGLYGVSASAGTATLTIANLATPAGFNTWVASAAGLASVSNNWSAGHPPTTSEHVLFDGRFSTANCEWDAAATATVASWTQTNDYTGVITLKTVYPGKGAFQCLTVTGPMAIMDGTITHPQSRTQSQSAADYLQDLIDNETYRVRIDAGSLTVGANGRIDARNKGYYHANSGNHTCPEPSHGGRLSASGQAPYDDVKEPIHIGMAYKRASGGYYIGIGGGAVYITSSGNIVVDGYIGADTGSDTWGRGYTLRNGAAAGSVYVRGASVTGTGTISASAVQTAEQNYRGVGGRVAVIATSSTPIDYTNLTLKASVYPFKSDGTSISPTLGGCGTVYVKDGTMTNGVLIVRNFDLTYNDAVRRSRTTEVTPDADWTFDRVELGGNVQLVVPYGTTLTLPGWDCVTAPYNTSGTPSGLFYRGGTLAVGSASDVTLSGHWYFAPVSNYVFNANVLLADGAGIGFGGKYTQQLANNAYPDALDAIHCTVNGDLTVPSGCAVNVIKAGAMQDSNGVPAGYPQGAHGGRRSNTMKTIGSVFRPRTLPHGQSNSYGHIIPGGAVELVVKGTFTLGGTVAATSYNGNDGITSQIGGGSIDLTAGRLVGDGSIKAGAVKNGQPGGRIAIRLTGSGASLADFDGTVDCATMGAGSIGSCGSVYVQNAADAEGRGTVVLDDNNVTCTTYTPICATGYQADDVAAFRHTDLVVRNQAKAQVSAADANGVFTMDELLVDETGGLDLFGHSFVVTSAKIAGRSVSSGTYTAAQLQALGLEGVVDTADGAGGTLVVRGSATLLFIK